MKLHQRIIARGMVLAGLMGMVGCESPQTKVEQRYVDLNSDKVNDILVVLKSNPGSMWREGGFDKHDAIVSMSQPDGSYLDQIIQYNEQPLELKIEDMNNDGRLDILAIVAQKPKNAWRDGGVRKYDLVVSYQNEDGTFQPQKVLRTYEGRPH